MAICRSKEHGHTMANTRENCRYLEHEEPGDDELFSIVKLAEALPKVVTADGHRYDMTEALEAVEEILGKLHALDERYAAKVTS